jgi:hypothetical protein
VSDYGLGDRGWIPGRGKRIFLLASVSRLADPFPRDKAWLGRDADYSLPSSAEVVNE